MGCTAAAAAPLAGPTAANPPYAAAAVDSWNRQTDEHRYTDPAAYHTACQLFWCRAMDGYSEADEYGNSKIWRQMRCGLNR